MTRQQLLNHADNLHKSYQEEKFRLSRHWLLRLKKEVDRVGMFIYSMDELMGHKQWSVGITYKKLKECTVSSI